MLPAQTHLLLRFPRNEPFEFALALEQGRVNAVADLCAGFMKQLQQRPRAASLTDEQRRSYFAESLYLNTVRYENDKLEAYMNKLSRK